MDSKVVIWSIKCTFDVFKDSIEQLTLECPKCLVHFYVASHYIKVDKTSSTYSMQASKIDIDIRKRKLTWQTYNKIINFNQLSIKI